MNNRILKLLSIMLCLLAGSSCDQEDPSMEERLINKNWRLTSITENAFYFGFWNRYYECEQDNVLRFGKDEVAIMDDGGTPCDSSFVKIGSGRWWIVGERDLHLPAPDKSWNTWTIVRMNASYLELEREGGIPVPGSEGKVYHLFTATFSAE